jgi:hypothetical protein
MEAPLSALRRIGSDALGIGGMAETRHSVTVFPTLSEMCSFWVHIDVRTDTNDDAITVF